MKKVLLVAFFYRDGFKNTSPKKAYKKTQRTVKKAHKAFVGVICR